MLLRALQPMVAPPPPRSRRSTRHRLGSALKLAALVTAVLVAFFSPSFLPLPQTTGPVDVMPQAPLGPIAIFSLRPYHYEVLLGFAEELQALGYHVSVYAKFKNVSSLGDGQGQSTAHILRNELRIPVIRDVRDYPASPVDRVVFISSQHEAVYQPKDVRAILQKLTPRVTMAVIHDASVPLPEGPLFYTRTQPSTVFVSLSPGPDTMFGSWLASKQLQSHRHDWALPVHWYRPLHSCHRFRPGCLAQFVVQGNFDPLRRDYARLFREMQQQGFDSQLQVLLLGKGELDIPAALQGNIVPKALLSYQDYLEEVHRSIALLPLFADRIYVDGGKISSTVIMSLICGTPLVADDDLLAAHPFLPRAATFYRPPGETELDAMQRILRMPREQWHATREALLAARRELRRRNAQHMNSLLQVQ